MSDFETVKQRADIVEVVSGYVALQKAGRDFKACCPFHNEKTPSFYVHPDQQTYHCFGCSAHGDVIKFIEKKENLTPVEAMRQLADRYGVQLAGRDRPANEPPTNRLIEANEAAAQYYHSLLLNASAGEAARAYIARRGLSDEAVRAFQLGASSDAWDALLRHLTERGFTEEELLTAGLISEGDRGRHDRFRSRLMYPIRDERGRVIGFGGRVLGDGKPKYLNTAQTPLFDKSGTLYALDRAKDAIRAGGVAVVVEGYMDAITAHEHGIANVVATLGTALTERHVSLLKRYARQVVLAMDADAAGIEAALRGEEVVRRSAGDEDAPGVAAVDWKGLVRVQAAAPLEVRVFTVPHGKDPDEAIRADPTAFRALTERAVPPFEFRLRHELARIDPTNPRELLALADRLLPLIAAIADRTVQSQYLARLAQATAIREEELALRMRSAGAAPAALPLRERVDRKGSPHPTRPAEPEPPFPTADDGILSSEEDGGPPAEAPRPRPAEAPLPGTRTETVCLRLLLTYPSLRETGLALDADLFSDPANRALFLAWRGAEPAALERALDEEERAQHARVLAAPWIPYDERSAAEALQDAAKRLAFQRVKNHERLLAAALRDAEQPGSRNEVAVAALSKLAGEPRPVEGELAEAVARMIESAQAGQARHALEVELRTHGAAAPSLAAGDAAT